MKQERISENAMANHSFRIKGCYYKGHCFPGLNEYIHAIGANPRRGNEMKRDFEMIARNAIRLNLKRFKTDKPVVLHYVFTEPKKGNKRDRMNIFAFADKVIEDALQRCKVIENDDYKHVVNTTHKFEWTDGKPSIEVYIEELERV